MKRVVCRVDCRWMIAFELLILTTWTQGAEPKSNGLVPVAVEDHFVTPGQSQFLRFRGQSGGSELPAYELLDFEGRRVDGGTVERSRDGELRVSVQLKPGYYDIVFPATIQRFGVVSLEAQPNATDPFFAVDAAMSWLVAPGPLREGLVKDLRRCGILMARERFRWASINTARDQFDWEADRQYETLRRTYARHGVSVLEMCHDSPEWMGLVERYPENLAAAADQWRRIASRWGDTWGAMEVWNEPDIFFGGNLPADQYVALVRAMAWGLDQSESRVPLVTGVLAHYDQDFLDAAAANGLLDLSDVLSFHSYARAPDMEALIHRFHQWLGDHDRQRLPLWITECGRPWRRGPERPPRDQDVESALDIVMKAVEAKAGGIQRYFAFVYPYYEERDNNFGMMGRRGTPLRSMAAYAYLAHVLQNHQYQGDLVVDDGRVKRSRVFQRGDRSVVVVYTGTPDPQLTVRLPVAAEQAFGLDGRRLAVRGNEVPVPDGLVYVMVKVSQVEQHLRQPSRDRFGTLARRASRVVTPVAMRLRLDASRWAAHTQGYRVQQPWPTKAVLPIQIWNLSAQAVALELVPGGDVVLMDPPERQSVTIEPHSATTVEYSVDWAATFADRGVADFHLHARLNSTNRPIPFMVRFRPAQKSTQSGENGG